MVISFDVKMGPSIKYWSDSASDIPTQRTVMRSGLCMAFRGHNVALGYQKDSRCVGYSLSDSL